RRGGNDAAGRPYELPGLTERVRLGRRPARLLRVRPPARRRQGRRRAAARAAEGAARRPAPHETSALLPLLGACRWPRRGVLRARLRPGARGDRVEAPAPAV